jgi:S1-C subfamily serine protease
MSVGTSFVVRPSILATNAHVISLDFAERLNVRFPSAPEDSRGPIKLRVLYVDNKRDIALLGAETDLPALALATGYEFKRGQDVTVIGNPGLGRDATLENAVSRGIMSSQTALNGLRYFQISIAINPGNSGGPVFDPSGRVLGIVTLKARNKEGLAFCIPIDDLQNALAIVDGQTPEDVAKMSALHRARVAFELLNQTTGIYEGGLEEYITAMQFALVNGISASAGLQAAEKAISKKVAEFNKVLAEDLQPNLAEIRDDPLVEQSVRTKLRDLWTTYKDMKNSFDDPRGTYDTFKTKTEILRDKRRRLVEALKKSFGIEGQE